jgi:hypothetical protein
LGIAFCRHGRPRQTEVRTTRDGDQVLVEIGDNCPAPPPASRIFAAKVAGFVSV